MSAIRLFSRIPGAVAWLIFFMLASGPLLATNITIKTPLGDAELELFDEETPQTVANFLNYLNSGEYDNTFIHRSDPGFVIQGGGYRFVDGVVDAVPTDPPLVNEPGISNLRGTIAMAKISGDPDSATSQWFINLKDNSAELDAQNGGFTVFGQVTGNGMDVIDAIAALQVWTFAAPFGELPLIDYPGNVNVTDEYLVMTEITAEDQPGNDGFMINPGLNDAWYDINTDGQGFYIAVFPDKGTMSVAWFTFDTERPDESVNAFLGGPGQRWLTAQGTFAGNTANLNISSTEGGIFDSAEPVPASRQDGTMTIEFIDCNTATVTYEIPSVNRQRVFTIQRVATDNVPVCEALSVPAVE